MMRPAEYVARRARDLIASGWTQGCPARDARGRPVDAYADEAVCFCALAAVHRAARAVGSAASHAVDEVLGAIARHAGITVPPVPTEITQWNDARGRELRNVLAAFDGGVAELSQRAAA